MLSEIEAIEKRGTELSKLSDEIIASNRPIRVKIIRLEYIRDQIRALLVEAGAIERAHEQSSGPSQNR